MTLFNQALYYEISWQVVDPITENFLIGFYTSDNFAFDVENVLFLITGNKGASIFCKPCGSFINFGTLNFYVATNEFVRVNVKV